MTFLEKKIKEQEETLKKFQSKEMGELYGKSEDGTAYEEIGELTQWDQFKVGQFILFGTSYNKGGRIEKIIKKKHYSFPKIVSDKICIIFKIEQLNGEIIEENSNFCTTLDYQIDHYKKNYEGFGKKFGKFVEMKKQLLEKYSENKTEEIK